MAYLSCVDMEAASGGLVKILTGMGVEVFIVVMTNGDKGCSNPEVCDDSTTNAELADIRIQEQKKSGEILGIPPENMYFLGYEDMLLKQYSRSEISQKLVSLLRITRPNVVMTWDSAAYLQMLPSEGWWDLGYHPDHQYSGELTLDAVWFAGEQRLWPDLGAAWKPQYLYFWAYNPDAVPSHYVDITGPPLRAKTEAFLQMKSQYTNTAEMAAMMGMLGVQMQATCNLPQGVMAEGFQFVLW
jgi:N,N'-diacetylchitobiose non-reducing end deacetylase